MPQPSEGSGARSRPLVSLGQHPRHKIGGRLHVTRQLPQRGDYVAVGGFLPRQRVLVLWSFIAHGPSSSTTRSCSSARASCRRTPASDRPTMCATSIRVSPVS